MGASWGPGSPAPIARRRRAIVAREGAAGGHDPPQGPRAGLPPLTDQLCAQAGDLGVSVPAPAASRVPGGAGAGGQGRRSPLLPGPGAYPVERRGRDPQAPTEVHHGPARDPRVVLDDLQTHKKRDMVAQAPAHPETSQKS